MLAFDMHRILIKRAIKAWSYARDRLPCEGASYTLAGTSKTCFYTLTMTVF